MKKLCLIALLFIVPFAFAKQKTTRTNLRVSNENKQTTATASEAVADTVRGDALALMLNVTGYEKPLRSRHETMLLTNRDSTLTISTVSLDIEYSDMQGRTLHRRTVDAAITLPPLSTRLLDVKSWDVNQLFYYHLNVPKRISTQATPYRVSITPIGVTTQSVATY
jgi:hypothetical protein